MLSVIPAPKSHSFVDGKFNITEKSTITISNDPEITAIAEMLAGHIQQAAGLEIKISDTGNIKLQLDEELKPG